MSFEQFLLSNKEQHIWSLLEYWAQTQPNKFAILDYRQTNPEKKALTFSQLFSKACGMVKALRELNVKPGQKALVFLRPSLDFHPLIFALFRLKIAPIFIDPAMPRAEFLKAVQLLRPEIMVIEPMVIWPTRYYGEIFSSVITTIISRPSLVMELPVLSKFQSGNSDDVNDLPWPQSQDLAAILYTSGGTGIPKAVPYTHSIFWHQTINLKKLFGLTENDVDYPGFPLFSMFTLCLGMQSGITHIDPRFPGRCNPEFVARDLLLAKATFAAGSPAIWERVGQYSEEQRLAFPHLKFLTMFGAPVSLRMHQIWSNLLPNGTTYAPYGATEALPVASMSGKEILGHYSNMIGKGQGTCVGRPAPQTELAIVEICDNPITPNGEIPRLPPGTLGEICVKGPITTQEYLFLEEETKLAKIKTKTGAWHRMGDLGVIDANGVLWFHGRKKHLLNTKDGPLSTESIEATYNNHPEIRRCALIWAKNHHGVKVPSLAIERKDGEILTGENALNFEQNLRGFSEINPLAKRVEHFVYVKKMPVDIRHNIKIDRQKLSTIYCR